MYSFKNISISFFVFVNFKNKFELIDYFDFESNKHQIITIYSFRFRLLLIATIQFVFDPFNYIKQALKNAKLNKTK